MHIIFSHNSSGLITWISNYIHYKEWDEIIYPFLNLNGATIEVLEWIRNFIPHYTECVITFHVGIKVNPC